MVASRQQPPVWLLMLPSVTFAIGMNAMAIWVLWNYFTKRR